MKVAVFSGGEIVERWTFGCREIGRFDEIFSRYAGFDRAILSSTRDETRSRKRCCAAGAVIF